MLTKGVYFILSKEFSHIPKEKWNRISTKNHINHEKVFRAVENISNITQKDFLPSNIQNKNRKISNTLSYYSVSLFCDRMSLENVISTIPSMRTKEIARGFTSFKRGISAEANQKSHVNYYLYDYINNSPYPDFIGDKDE